MKILTIGEKRSALFPLQKRLIELGFNVKIDIDEKKGLESYDSFNPDLVIVDINMNEISGLNIINYIRNFKKSEIPIIVLLGNKNDDIITEAFELGINDCMKKPLSLNEVCIRVKRLIGVLEIKKINKPYSDVVINQRSVGVVIPCYNEDERLLSSKFKDFLNKNSGYHLCFVNDGSNDNTLEELYKLQKGVEDFVTVYNCEENKGKAEAVRIGMLHMAEKDYLDYVGFLDADLSTDLSDFEDLVKIIETSDFKIVSGSRISRMGADIAKESARKIISLTINFIIRKILLMDFKDTQCGAKVFHKDVIEVAFSEKFISKWIFDVEIFMRMRRYYSLKSAKSMLCEQPLKRWIHADGSKLSMKDSFKIIGQLAQIAWVYRDNKAAEISPEKELSVV